MSALTIHFEYPTKRHPKFSKDSPVDPSGIALFILSPATNKLAQNLSMVYAAGDDQGGHLLRRPDAHPAVPVNIPRTVEGLGYSAFLWRTRKDYLLEADSACRRPVQRVKSCARPRT